MKPPPRATTCTNRAAHVLDGRRVLATAVHGVGGAGGQRVRHQRDVGTPTKLEVVGQACDDDAFAAAVHRQHVVHVVVAGVEVVLHDRDSGARQRDRGCIGGNARRGDNVGRVMAAVGGGSLATTVAKTGVATVAPVDAGMSARLSAGGSQASIRQGGVAVNRDDHKPKQRREGTETHGWGMGMNGGQGNSVVALGRLLRETPVWLQRGVTAACYGTFRARDAYNFIQHTAFDVGGS